MADVRATCINKQPRNNPYEGITHLSGDGGCGRKWTHQQVVNSIESNTMRSARVWGLACVMAAVAACDSDAQRRAETLTKENEALRKELAAAKHELEDLKFGAARLLAQVKAEERKGSWKAVKMLAEQLIQRHPAAPEASKAKAAIAAAEAALKKAEREARLAEARRQQIERQKQLAEERRLAAALTRMRKKVDKVERTDWYRDLTSPQYTNYNGFFLYVGHQKPSAPFLRFRVQYNADDWLFIRSFLVVADGQRFDYDGVRFDRDNKGGEIWEWYDIPVSRRELSMLEAVIESKSSVLRLNGEHYRKDRTITSTEKAALRNVLDAYKVLGGK